MEPLKLTDMRVLWPVVFSGPTAWVVHLQGVYALSAPATEHGRAAPLHALSALSLLAAVTGGLLAWRVWRTAGQWAVGTAAPAAGRVRYLTAVGMLASALFVCVNIPPPERRWLRVTD